MAKKPTKKTGKAKPKAPTAAQLKERKLGALVKEAKASREGNSKLLRELRDDPGLADEVKALLCADLVRVSEIPREILGPSASRDRYRQLGHYSTSLVDFVYGVWAEFKRQAGIQDTLQTASVKRNIAKSARAQDLADYADEHMRPWNGAYSSLKLGTKPVQILIGSDFHSHFCNPFALRMWHTINKEYKPDAVRINGDLVDFPALSTHRHFPGHFPMTVQDELDWAVDKVLTPTRKGNPKADIKFLIGNHDVRLAIALADKGPMFASLRSNSFAEQFKLDENQIGLVCRSNFLHLSAKQRKSDIAQNWEEIYCPRTGRLLFVICHGWLTGAGAPRKHMSRFMCHGSNGHLHNRERVSGGSRATGTHDWFQTSCMASPEAVAAGYIHGPIEFNGWSCGGLMVTIYPDTGHVTGDFFEVGPDIATFRGRSWKIRQHERDTLAAMLEI